MREVTTHRIDKMNDGIRIEVHGEPGLDGKQSRYCITAAELSSSDIGVSRPKAFPGTKESPGIVHTVCFHEGPNDTLLNGVTEAVLLAIVMDRLDSKTDQNVYVTVAARMVQQALLSLGRASASQRLDPPALRSSGADDQSDAKS